MNKLKKYVVRGLSDLTEKSKFADIDKLYSYEMQYDTLETDLLIGSLFEIPQDASYRIYFFSVAGSVRESIIKSCVELINFSNISSWNFVIDKYINLLNQLAFHVREKKSMCHIVINLSFGDFALLIPKDCCEDVDETLSFITNFLIPKLPNAKSIWEQDEEIVFVKDKILHRLNTQHIYNYNSRSDDYKDLFTSMLNADVDTTDRAWSIARQACVLLHNFLDEMNIIWMDANGESKVQTLEYQQDIKRSYENFSKNYRMFLNQVSSDSIFADSCWSYSFICDALLSSFVGQSVDTTKKVRPAEFNDFHGFMPIISKETQTMDSFYCEQFGALYSSGFLLIPYNVTFKLWEMLPALVHEFSHYISTPGRIKRNDTILELTLCSIINPLISEIKNTVYYEPQNLIAENVYKKLLDRYNELACWVSPYRQSDEDDLMDSMFFLNVTMSLFEIIDFEDLYDHALQTIEIPENLKLISYKIKDTCVENWEKNRFSYLLTYTMALREIRSDIAMCDFLDIDIEDYILLMANEPTWASCPWEYTADSVIFRLGFMTRYLFYKDDPSRTSRYDFNISWKQTTKNIFVNLSKKHPHLANKFNNMWGYIERYIEINLAEEYDCCSNTVLSIFEEKLFPMPILDEDKRKQTIVGCWEEQFENKKHVSSFIHKLKKCYKEYNEKNDEERIIMNYQSRLIMRDLFMFFPDIDE